MIVCADWGGYRIYTYQECEEYIPYICVFEGVSKTTRNNVQFSLYNRCEYFFLPCLYESMPVFVLSLDVSILIWTTYARYAVNENEQRNSGVYFGVRVSVCVYHVSSWNLIRNQIFIAVHKPKWNQPSSPWCFSFSKFESFRHFFLPFFIFLRLF